MVKLFKLLRKFLSKITPGLERQETYYHHIPYEGTDHD